MKRNILFSMVLLLAVCLTVDSVAQKAKKKGAGAGGGAAKKSATTTKSNKKKGKGDKSGAGDSQTGNAGAAPTTTPPPAASTEPEVPMPVEDTGIASADIVADADSFDFKSVDVDSTKPLDGYYKLANLKGAKPFPFPENDKNSAKFYKRIWREIDTRDSENRIFAIPGETLIQFIMDGIKNGKLIAYEDDAFKKKITYSKVMQKFRDSSIMTLIDTTGEITGTKTVANQFNPDSVTRFELKEDIFFDKVRGRVVTEIIGMGPVKKLKTTTGVEIGDSHPFYLNFKHCRNLFAAKEVIDPQRDIYNISFDDIFLQRAFKSTIIKESNPQDLRIKDKYPDRARQIKESNRIEREIQRYKRNLWKF